MTTMLKAEFDTARRQWTPGSVMATVFAIAVVVRWAYAAWLYASFGASGLMTADSFGYLKGAQEFAQRFSDGALHGWDWLGADLSWMPFFLWLLAANVRLFGEIAPLTTVFCQGVIDAGTCVLICAMVAQISPRYALACGILAAFNPTQVVLSALIYTDALFLFFVTLSLFGAARWLRQPSWSQAFIIAIGLGGGALTRVFLALWSPILIIILFAACLIGRRLGKPVAAQLAMIAAIVALCISPILARNVTQYSAWALTAQGGTHLLYWVVPLVSESKTGTPWAAGVKTAGAEFRSRFPNESDNPFIEDRRRAELGREKLLELGPSAIAKAWITGAAINLASPAIITLPPVAALPRTGYYDTKGANAVEKIVNFLFRSDNALFAWIALAGIAGVGVMGLLQLAGLLELLWRPGTLAVLLLLGLWTGFVLAINGPAASPKYRLPIEPVLVLLAGVGFCAIKDRFTRAWAKEAIVAS